MHFDSFIISRRSILAHHISDLSHIKSTDEIEMEERKAQKIDALSPAAVRLTKSAYLV